MSMQAILVLTLPVASPSIAVWSCAIASLAGACALLREALRTTSPIGIRTIRGRFEVLEDAGLARPATAVLATATIVVLELSGKGRSARFLPVWRDALSATEFRRLLTAARWTRRLEPISAV